MELYNLLMRITIILLIFSILKINSANAALGDKSSKIASEKKIFQAKTHTIKNLAFYSLHELTKDGLTLREYVSSEGTVFAVVWQGMTHPDLTTLLGEHHHDYHQALKDTQPANRQKFSLINANDLVVEKSGHMRAVRGRAYVPSLIPSGVSLDEIK